MKKNLSDKKILRVIRIIPIVISIGIIPLIIRVIICSNKELTVYPWFSQDYKFADIFLAGKAFLIQILSLICFLFLLIRTMVLKQRLSYRKEFLLLFFYMLFVLISGLLSRHSSLAFKGSYERFEPVGVIIGYLTIFYYSFISIKDKNDLELLIKIGSFFTGIMLLIGIMQSIGYDPFGTRTIKKFVVPLSLHDKLDGFQMLREKGVAYLTLYNEDYVGVYLSLLIPIYISLLIVAHALWKKLIALLFTISSFYVLFHAHSLSGWITLTITGMIAIMILLKRNKSLIIYGMYFVLASIVVIISFKTVRYIRDRINGAVIKSSDRVQKVIELKTLDDEVVFKYFDGNELHCSYIISEGSFMPRFKDGDGNELIFYNNNGEYTLEERYIYADASVHIQEMNSMDVAIFEIDNHLWPIVKVNDKGYYYLNHVMKLVKVLKVENIDLFDNEFLSGRGAIWNRSVPIIKKHILIGSGANTFITEYPQDDYVYLNYLYGNDYCDYNVKAHSLYLGNMIENSVIGTLFLIAFFGLYTINGVRLFSKSFSPITIISNFDYTIGFGMFMGCVTCFITGLVNDSNVCVAPVFWALFGVSTSNMIYLKKVNLDFDKNIYYKGELNETGGFNN